MHHIWYVNTLQEIVLVGAVQKIFPVQPSKSLPWLFLVSDGFPPSWYWMSLLVPIRSNHQNRGFLNWKPITVFGDVVKTTRIGILIDSTFNLVCWRDWLPANCNCGQDYAGQEGGRVWIKRCKISLSKYLHIFANIGVSPTFAHGGLFAPFAQWALCTKRNKRVELRCYVLLSRYCPWRKWFKKVYLFISGLLLLRDTFFNPSQILFYLSEFNLNDVNTTQPYIPGKAI